MAARDKDGEKYRKFQSRDETDFFWKAALYGYG